MSAPLTNPTPKQEFLLNAASVKAHRELMQNPKLRLSFATALLQYQRITTGPDVLDGNAAAANFLKLQGAQKFLDILINLAEPPALLPAKTDKSKIDYTV